MRDKVTIHELNLAMAHTLDQDVLLGRIAEAAMAQFQADEASVMLVTGDGRALRVAAVCVATCFVGIMMLVAAIGRNEQSTSAAGWAILMPMSMIGGDARPAAPAPQMMEREFAMASVTVAGDDISGIVVTGTRGARAAGRVVFEGGPAPEPLTSLRLVASPTDLDNMAAASSSFGLSAVREGGARRAPQQ